MNKPAALFIPEAAEPARFTADEFLRMYDLGAFGDRSVELVHGEIFELSPAHSPHAQTHARVIHSIGNLYGIEHVYADAFIRLDGRSLRAFDVTVLHEGVDPESVLKPEEVLLGVEVAHSSIARDLGEKMLHYAAAGIVNYLVVDLNTRELLLMTGPGSDGFAKVEKASFEVGLYLPGAGRLRLG